MTDCDAIAFAVAEGRPIEVRLRAHVDACARCRELVDSDGALDAVVNRGDGGGEMPAALRALIESDARPVAPFSAWRRAAPPLALGTLVALGALVVAPRADLAHQHAFAWSALVLAALVAAGALAALHRGARGLGVPWAQRVGYVAAALALAEAAVASVSHPVEGSEVLARADALRGAVHCASLGALVAVLVGAALFAAARRTAVTAPTASGAAAGASAGLAGTLALHVVCPIATLDHAMTGHVAPALLGALVGAALGRRALSV